MFIWHTLPTWLRPSAWHARSTANSSAQVAMCGSQSLMSCPLLPCFLNFRLLASRLFPPVPIGVMTLPKLAGRGCPCRFVSSGFGSNRSMWLGPPSMNRNTTRFAFAGKCVALGANESAWVIAESASDPNPPPARRRKSRRDWKRGTCMGDTASCLGFCGWPL